MKKFKKYTLIITDKNHRLLETIRFAVDISKRSKFKVNCGEQPDDKQSFVFEGWK
jgi:hypothetical protein